MPSSLPESTTSAANTAQALLPAGLRDVLPPEAENEAISVEKLLSCFAQHGYQRVNAPLVEFEDSLLAGSGEAMSEQTFRLMDPDSQRMMGVRADMTPQVARIAATRLVNAPRPLRLSYLGSCLRVRGVQPVPDRQVRQAGIELIGPDSAEADAETILVAAEALNALGLEGLSFDLTLPPLAPLLLTKAGVTGIAQQNLLHALDRKDGAAIAAQDPGLASLLERLLDAAGPAATALPKLKQITLPRDAEAMVARLRAVVSAIHRRAPDLRLTIDPLHCRSFRYHRGVYVTIYAAGCYEELGRGGRYTCGDNEAATGLTLFPDSILRAAAPRDAAPRLFVPMQEQAHAAKLRRGGYATIAALEAHADDVAEARRLQCTHVLRDGDAVLISGK